MKEKILIIRFSSIGDIIHCSAIPRHLKNRFPQSDIHWATRSDNLELIKNSPYVSSIHTLHKKDGLTGLIKFSKHLREMQFTHVYDAHNNLRSHILCFFLKPKFFIRRAKSRFKRFLLFWFKINLFEKDYRAVDSYIEPLKKWQIKNDLKGPELHLSENIHQKIRTLWNQSTPTIAVAPATAWPKKTWPLGYWKNLIQKILKETPYNIIILGGPEDTFCQELILNSQRIFNLQGKLTVLESAAAAAQCLTLVAADTGILHMTECLEKDVVGILGPTPFGHPYRKSSIGLQKKVWCQPCSKDGSGLCVNSTYQKCMRLIEPDFVYENVKHKLRDLSS